MKYDRLLLAVALSWGLAAAMTPTWADESPADDQPAAADQAEAPAAAEDDAQDQQAGPVIQMHGFVIGPDGKMNRLDFNSQGIVEAKLPEWVQKMVKEGVKLQEGEGEGEGEPATGLFRSGGKIVVIGPDGKKTIKTFGNLAPEDLPLKTKKVDLLLKILPEGVDEEARAAFAQAMGEVLVEGHPLEGTKVVEGHPIDPIQPLKGKMIIVGPDGVPRELPFDGVHAPVLPPMMGMPHVVQPAGGADAISAKLDQILERLEKLEARVDQLQEK